MERLPRGERHLSHNDVLRPLRRIVLAHRWLENIEAQHKIAQERVLGHFAVTGTRGYIPPVQEIYPEPMARDIREYLKLELVRLWSGQHIESYTSGLERGLEGRLQPERGTVPVIRAVARGEHYFHQAGEIVERPGDDGQVIRTLEPWKRVKASAAVSHEVEGECVAVMGSTLYVVSAEHYDVVFAVNPLDARGNPDPDVELSVLY